MENQGFQGGIMISVTDPQVDSAKGHHTYLVVGSDQFGPFEVRRRFNDFFFLRETLVRKWPGVYIPPIPEKKISGNRDELFVDFRKRLFNYFVNRIAVANHIYYSPEMQEFLRNKSIDMERFYQTVPVPKSSDLVEKYTATFKDIDLSNSSTTKAMAKITEFMMFLRRAEKELKSIREIAEEAAEARESYNNSLKLCCNSLLPEYESRVYVEYLSPELKEIERIFSQNQQVEAKKQRMYDSMTTNCYQIFFDLVAFEQREIEALIESVQGLETLQSSRRKLEEKILSDQSEMAKLQGGKTTFKSIFSKGSKVDQIYVLERMIPENQKEMEGLTQLIGIVYCIMAYYEIPAFKTYKRKQYYETLANLANCEIKYLCNYSEFMRSMMDALPK